MADYEKKEGKGSLWSDQDAKVINKGSIYLDGKDEYFTILKGKDGQGRDKLELLKSVGLIYANKEKLHEGSPDVGGKVLVNGERYKFGGWKRTTEDGREWVSAGLDPIKEEEELRVSINDTAKSIKAVEAELDQVRDNLITKGWVLSNKGWVID